MGERAAFGTKLYTHTESWIPASQRMENTKIAKNRKVCENKKERSRFLGLVLFLKIYSGLARVLFAADTTTPPVEICAIAGGR